MSRRADLAIAAILVIAAIALWFWLIPVYAGAGDQAILPRLAAIAIGGLAAALFAVRLVSPGERPIGSDAFVELGGDEPLPVLALTGIWGLFIASIELVGFHLGGAAALVASFLVFGIRRPLAVALWTAGIIVAVHLVFERLLALRLPTGVLGSALGF